MKRIAAVFTLLILFIGCSSDKENVNLIEGRWQSQNSNGSIYPVLIFNSGDLTYQLSEKSIIKGVYSIKSGDLEIELKSNPGRRHIYKIDLKDNSLKLTGKGDFIFGDPNSIFVLIR